MVSIIKNQLLKHLSRFTKNLSADKINLSTFKGEGELTNLELNEEVLTDLLELPSWLRITKALCNKVLFRIPWTKLKNVPIQLRLDEVDITVDTCEELRFAGSPQGGLASYTTLGKYSFIHKVIDGITVTVNTVNIIFNSPAFVATVQIQRILVESVTPKFTRMELPMTRLKNPEKGQLLIFKEMQWQTLRIEAKSTKDLDLTPLKLLTNEARCRIVIKKRLSDCFILGSRLGIILDKLLWVLTDSQLKAALHFLSSLSGLIEKSTQITRKAKAARKLDELPEYRAQLAQEARRGGGKQSQASSRVFEQYDVVETSYHFVSNNIALHLCDDLGEGRSTHPNLKDGGVLQIDVKRFRVDFYPYHLAKGDRKHWPSYNGSSVPHAMWQEQALAAFRAKFMDLFEKGRSPGSATHTPLSRASKVRGNEQQQQQGPDQQSVGCGTPQRGDLKRRLEMQLNKLMSTCVVIRIEDFTIYKVSTSGKKQALKEFLGGDRYRMSLPKDASIVHAEYIYYYYPSDVAFPVPAPKFYAQLNPIQIFFDLDTSLWLNSFGLYQYHSLMGGARKTGMLPNDVTYVDVKVEAILPRLNFESASEYHNQRDRPKCLSLQVTRATFTNIRSLDHSSRADLAKCVDSFHMGSLFFGSEFPSRADDLYVITQKFLDHISAADNVRTAPDRIEYSDLERSLSRELLWTEAKDVWSISLDPVYGDFLGAQTDPNKPVPFLDPVPVTIWIHASLDPNSTIIKRPADGESRNADIHALAYISNLVSVQLNHYQYLFLLRLADQAAELTTFLNVDSDRVATDEGGGASMVVGALIPQLEVTFVMPPQSPGKESSGGDGESFVPDISSIDDMTVGILRNSNRSIPQLESRCVWYSENCTSRLSQSLPEYVEPVGAEPPSPAPPPPVDSKNPFQNNINAGLSSMKKGFTSLISSFDSALKPSADDLMSDTMSIRSDASSDSEQIVMINYEEDVRGVEYMFYVEDSLREENVEEAAEVLEEESTVTSNSDHSLTSSCRRKDLVCVSTFKLKKVEFLQQSRGYSSSIKIQVGDMLSEECASIPWDEFQGKFSMRSRGWVGNPEDTSTTAKVRLRLDRRLSGDGDPLAFLLLDRESFKKMFSDSLIVQVRDVTLSVNMSTVTGLADLIEDEIIPVPLPMQLSIENIKIHLTEDRPPANITSPGPIPIDLHVTELYVTRGDDGVFHIVPRRPDDEVQPMLRRLQREHSAMSMQSTNNNVKLTNLLMDNEELRRRLAAFERISEENRALRKAKEEAEELRVRLESAQDDVARLLDEKRRLLDELETALRPTHNKTAPGTWQWNTKNS